MADSDSDISDGSNRNDETLVRRPLHEYLTSRNMVTIQVGSKPKRKTFCLHEDLICDRVEFFKSAFQSGFLEALEKNMSMPEEDPIAFGHLVDWIYMGEVVCQKCKVPQPAASTTKDLDHELQWARLWVLADKLALPELVDIAEIRWIECMLRNDFDISPETVSYIYDNTAESSHFRVCMVRLTAHIFLKKDRFPMGMAAAMATNKDLAFEVMKLLKEHIEWDGSAGGCDLLDCPLHGNTGSKSLWKRAVKHGYKAALAGKPNPAK